MFDAMNRPVATIASLGRTNTFTCDAGGNRLTSTRPDGTTNTVFYHGDAQHSTLALTDASANVLERYRYEAFGLPSIYDSTFNLQPSTGYGNRILFQGREWLADARLNDHRFRYYSPDIQRWLSRDPIGETGGKNIYRMCRNTPVGTTDKLGLSPQDVAAIHDLFDCILHRLNSDGLRLPVDGYLLANLNNLLSHVTDYGGCAEQATALFHALTSSPYTNSYVFTYHHEWVYYIPFMHQWVTGDPINLTDPQLTLDPWVGRPGFSCNYRPSIQLPISNVNVNAPPSKPIVLY